MNQDNEHIQTDSPEARARLWTLIKDIRFAMFTSRHSNGHLHARPMTTQNAALDEDRSLWFFMSRRGEPVADIAADPMVNVVYADPGTSSYVSITGNAALVVDATRSKALWTSAATAWFPGGPADADLALVQVQIVHANYWNIEAGRLAQLFHIAAAAVSGKPPRSLGEQTRILMD